MPATAVVVITPRLFTTDNGLASALTASDPEG